MYVYFIKAFNQHPMIKIGKSKNPEGRIGELQVGSPVKLQLIGKIKCKSDLHALSVERFAHNLFSHQNRRGEWFRFGPKKQAMLMRLIRTVSQMQDETDLGEDLMRSMDAEVRAIVGGGV